MQMLWGYKDKINVQKLPGCIQPLLRRTPVARPDEFRIIFCLVEGIAMVFFGLQVRVAARQLVRVCALAIGILVLAALRVDAQQPKQVLILYSNESLLPANIAFGKAIREHMRAGLAERVEFFIEFLDLIRFSGQEHETRTAVELRAKYTGRHIDLVVAGGPQALDLLAAHRDTLFPAVPLVYAAVREEHLARRKISAATGILMRLDPVPTLELALRLQPETRRVVVITGAADSDREWERVARNRFRSYEGRLEFVYKSGLPMPQLLTELQSLKSGTVVFYLTIFKDGAGQNFIAADAARQVAEASAVPVYGLFDTYLGLGIVGGHVDTFENVGRETARIGLRILAGANPDNIPPSFPGDGETIVDWRQLRRWGLSEGLLPAGTDIRFRQPSLWEEHRGTVLAVVGVIVLQTILLFALLIQLRNRRRAEAEVRRQEEEFRLVVESMPSAIIKINPKGQIVLVNAQTEKTFGYLRKELLGLPVELLLPVGYLTQQPGFWAGYFAAPCARALGAVHELNGRRKDGNEFPVEIGLTPVEASAGLRVLIAIVDITERKQAEETRHELAHASRLALVGEITASIAHEITQPLGAILSNADAADMLLDSAPDSLVEVRQILDDIRKDDLRANEVIRRLRGLLRKREVEFQPVHLNEVTTEVVALLRGESRRRDVIVQTDLVGNLPLVGGDKIQLQQILLNLFLNSMDAMAELPGMKTLTVRTALQDNAWVEIAVADTGAGILPEQLPRLFDPFFSTKKEGMGLGLSIARTLVEAHGGRIWAKNNPVCGATFFFTVPVGEQKSNEEQSDMLRASMELIA